MAENEDQIIDIQDNEPESAAPVAQPSHIQWIKDWYLARKKWTIPASVLLVILILAGLPVTRYRLSGLVLKKNFTVQVLDSETNSPVSGADVSMLLKTVQTDNNGKAVLKGVKVGSHSMLAVKKYYADTMTQGLVPILSQKNPLIIKLKATGRQTKITVKNTINQTPIANATIKAADTTAKTDKNGVAIIVLPVGVATQKATLSAAGFNQTDGTLKVSDTAIENNQLNLTPAGKVYFLSKLSGTIDVVRTNLDGTDRQTVLAGTGNEDDQGTVLLASRDWKYLALLSRRAGEYASIYLIDTTNNDSLTTIDEGSANFSLVGWDNHRFIYVVDRNSVNDWQTGKEALKSFDAESKAITPLDQTDGSGSGQNDFVRETYGAEYILYNGEVDYIKNWTSSYSYNSWQQIAAKQATFNSINADGTNHKTIKSFGLPSGTQAGSVTISDQLKNPNTIELQVPGDGKNDYYAYSDGQVKNDPNTTDDNYYTAYISTYLESPSSNSTFWAEPRDGKNTLFIGDQEGLNSKQIAVLSDYNPYGWYTDKYLLVSKNASELYIMSADGKNVIKVSDYHKPVQSYNGYGGGYGGV